MSQFSRDWFTRINIMQHEMHQLLDHFSGSKPPMIRFSPLVWEPAIDIYETAEHIVVNAELAGVKESDIEIIVDRDTFTIRGNRSKDLQAGIKRVYYRMEIASGHFRRSFKLPVAVDTTNIKASYECGLVEVILPKAKAEGTQKFRIQDL